MKSNMNNTNHKEEENTFYKCHFCQQKINVYDTEKHFASFHKFRHNIESEYVCEFCDDFEEFHSQTILFHHIQNTHNLIKDKQLQLEAVTNVDTLEEGKSRFLELIVNFNSKNDVFNLLQWIKDNDSNTFMTNHLEIDNEVLVVETNLSKATEEDDEKILPEDIYNADSNFVVDLDHETDVISTNKEIENEVLVVEENISKITEEEDKQTLLEDMDNAGFNSIVDPDQENDVSLTQRDINTFIIEHQGIENQALLVEKNISKTTADDDGQFLYEDTDNTDSNSLSDLDQETDIILNQGEIVLDQDCSENETFKEDKFHKIPDDYEEPRYESCSESLDLKKNIQDAKCHKAENLKTRIITSEGQKYYKCKSCGKSYTQAHNLKKHISSIHKGLKDYKCESCGKSFSQAGSLKKHIHTVHEGHKDFKCESCGKSFSEAGVLKKHIHTVHKGHKDYKCDSCDKSFTSLQKLENHFHSIHE